MPRLSGHTVMGLASLLVGMVVAVVVVVELPAIVGAPRARPSTAAPKGLTTPISTATFRLQMPPQVWLEYEHDTHDTLESLGADQADVDEINISAVRYNGVGVIRPDTLQSQERKLLAKTHGSVGTCGPAGSESIGGVQGTVAGYLYDGGPAGGVQTCDVWWFGTNRMGNVEYTFETVASPSDLSKFNPLAEQVRGSITWLI